MKKFIYLVIFIGLFTSCISTKKTTYFQGEPVQKSEVFKVTNEPYRLQVNDILHINIKSVNQEIVSLFRNESGQNMQQQNGANLYFNGYTVDRNGNIRMPYIGELNVLGYTTKEVREKIENQLSNFVKNTESIFVTVKLAGIQFVVTGEVNSPGTINLTQNHVTIVDAIANAGEISEFGDRQQVTIIRKNIGDVQKIILDLTDIAVFESEHFYIKPNDIIYVPPLNQKAWGTGTTGFQTFSTVVTVLSFIASTVLLIKNL